SCTIRVGEMFQLHKDGKHDPQQIPIVPGYTVFFQMLDGTFWQFHVFGPIVWVLLQFEKSQERLESQLVCNYTQVPAFPYTNWDIRMGYFQLLNQLNQLQNRDLIGNLLCFL